VRPTWLHFPSDAATLDLDAQFMEGGHLLVAPVLTPHAETVSAYLPAGSWLHAFGNRTIHSTGQTVTLPAAIGEPAALVLLDEAGEPPSELQPFVAAVARLLR
jgi:alpha-glucosidase (family GH31 glycosyl hydrolase)